MDQLAQTRRATGLAGIAAAVLFGTGSALWGFEQPDSGASVEEIIRFYTEASGRIVVGASLSLLAIAAVVVFASGARTILRDAEGDDLLANTAFGGALLMAAAGLGAETINMVGALRADDGQLTGELAQAVFEISYVLGYNAAGVGAGVFALATAAVALRTRAVLPRWLAVLSIIVGAALLTPLSPVLLGPGLLVLVAIGVQLFRSPQAQLKPSDA